MSAPLTLNEVSIANIGRRYKRRSKLQRNNYQLEGIKIVQEKITEDAIIRHGVLTCDSGSCIECGGELRRSHSRERSFADIPYGEKKTELIVDITTYKCQDCSKTQTPMPAAIQANRRITNRAIEYILSLSARTLSNVALSKIIGISEKVIRTTRADNDRSNN